MMTGIRSAVAKFPASLGVLALIFFFDGPAMAEIGRRSCPEFKIDSTDPKDRSRPLVYQFNLVRAVALKLGERGYGGAKDGVYTEARASGSKGKRITSNR
jgi:hypothetical protein